MGATWSRASESECAGSVDTTSVECPAAANLTASDAAELVLPTPPLPPSITYRRSGPAGAHWSAMLQCKPYDTKTNIYQVDEAPMQA